MSLRTQWYKLVNAYRINTEKRDIIFSDISLKAQLFINPFTVSVLSLSQLDSESRDGSLVPMAVPLKHSYRAG